MSCPTLRAIIGLGANLGDARATLVGAARKLSRVATLHANSSLYRTRPVGGPPQPDYLNAAIDLSFEGEPLALLDALLAIETYFGRERRERFGPRTLDLDVLWIDAHCIDSERLTVPHPRLLERGFALIPLLELRPRLVHPTTNRPITLTGVDVSGVDAQDSPAWIDASYNPNARSFL